jgi:transposase
VYGLISGHRRPRTSLIAARIGERVEAPLWFEGPCKTAVFHRWLEQQLSPMLNDNHVVVMDNVPFHKTATTRELIESTGAILLFLPPYSPDFSSMENAFAAIKKNREDNEHETLDSIIKH